MIKILTLAVCTMILTGCGSTSSVPRTSSPTNDYSCVVISQFDETMSATAKVKAPNDTERIRITDDIRRQALVVGKEFRMNTKQRLIGTGTYNSVMFEENSTNSDQCIKLEATILDFVSGYKVVDIEPDRYGARPGEIEGKLSKELTSGYKIDRIDTAEFSAVISITTPGRSNPFDEFTINKTERKLGRLTRQDRNIEDLIQSAAEDIARRMRFGR